MIKIDRESRRVQLKIAGLDALTLAGIQHGSYVAGRGLVRATSAEILRKPKGGKVYIRVDRAGRRRRHVASAAGETHANMTGKLRKSMSFRVHPSKLEFGYGVFRDPMPHYGEYLEYGTSKMDARPSLQNGIKSERKNMIQHYQNEIGKQLGDKVTK